MKVLLIIDMIAAFYQKGNLKNPEEVAKIIQPIVNLARKIVAEGGTIIFLRDEHEENDREFEMFSPHAVTEEERAIIEELQEFLLGSIIIGKTRYSAFYGTDLEKELDALRPEELIEVGVCTDICILLTAADGRNRDYKVTVPRDCVTTYDAPGHFAHEVNEGALDYMEKILGVRVVEKWSDV